MLEFGGVDDMEAVEDEAVELRSIILGSLALESANDVNFIFIHRP